MQQRVNGPRIEVTSNKRRKKMESILDEEKALKYPFLGVGTNGNVILFSEHGIGTVVHKSAATDMPVGEYAVNFCMDMFKPLKGKITLRN